jgi:hypothetical protein
MVAGSFMSLFDVSAQVKILGRWYKTALLSEDEQSLGKRVARRQAPSGHLHPQRNRQRIGRGD